MERGSNNDLKPQKQAVCRPVKNFLRGEQHGDENKNNRSAGHDLVHKYLPQLYSYVYSTYMDTGIFFMRTSYSERKKAFFLEKVSHIFCCFISACTVFRHMGTQTYISERAGPSVGKTRYLPLHSRRQEVPMPLRLNIFAVWNVRENIWQSTGWKTDSAQNRTSTARRNRIKKETLGAPG